MIEVRRRIVVVLMVASLGSFGGIETHTIGVVRGLIQRTIFFGLAVLVALITEWIEGRKHSGR